jgi:hypothetical protein
VSLDVSVELRNVAREKSEEKDDGEKSGGRG